MERYFYVGIGILMACICAMMLRMYLVPWLKCRRAGHPLTLFDLAHIVTSGAKTGLVADAYVAARRAGLSLSVRDLTSLYLASPRLFVEEVKRLIETSGHHDLKKA